MSKLFIIFLMVVSLYGSALRWYGDYDTALEKAKEQQKILMVLLINNDSKQSGEMVYKLFTNQPYIKKLKKEVVAVIVNNESKASYPREMYWTNRYPTLFFVNSKSEIFLLQPVYNDIGAKEFETLLATVLN